MFLQVKILLFSLAALCSAQLDPNCFSITGPIASFYLRDASGLQEITDGSALNPNATTFFIIHGWIDSHTGFEFAAMSTDLYAVTGGNVILVDYKELALKNYATCAWAITHQVGNFVSDFIAQETLAGTMNPSRIHLIGHSLGGQTAGNVGQGVKTKTGIKIKRISALDPAGPLFTVVIIPVPWVGLSANDAEVVDVSHTSTLFGTLARVGTVDFYLSGFLGLPTLPPSCINSPEVLCSHWLAKSLFRESITSCGIVGKTSNWFNPNKKAVYGLHMSLGVSGVYNFDTAAQQPYGTSPPAC